MKTALFVLALSIGFYFLYKTQEPRLQAHNKYMCAVYGYEEDCQTPLPPERRLK